MIYKMTIATGDSKPKTHICYGADDVATQREHYRSLAPRGVVQTINVKALNR